MATILVVDDDPDIRGLIQAILEGAGHSVTVAADGQEALNKLKRKPYELVLIATVGPSSARAQTPADWRAAVQQLLQQRARAVTTGDKGAFDATMSFAPDAFRATKDTWFSRMRALPIGSYTLSFDLNGYQDL